VPKPVIKSPMTLSPSVVQHQEKMLAAIALANIQDSACVPPRSESVSRLLVFTLCAATNRTATNQSCRWLHLKRTF
jgi:hypothetical protein